MKPAIQISYIKELHKLKKNDFKYKSFEKYSQKSIFVQEYTELFNSIYTKLKDTDKMNLKEEFSELQNMQATVASITETAKNMEEEESAEKMKLGSSVPTSPLKEQATIQKKGEDHVQSATPPLFEYKPALRAPRGPSPSTKRSGTPFPKPSSSSPPQIPPRPTINTPTAASSPPPRIPPRPTINTPTAASPQPPRMSSLEQTIQINDKHEKILKKISKLSTKKQIEDIQKNTELKIEEKILLITYLYQEKQTKFEKTHKLKLESKLLLESLIELSSLKYRILSNEYIHIIEQLKNDQLKNDQLKNDQLKNDQLKSAQQKINEIWQQYKNDREDYGKALQKLKQKK